MNETPAQGLLSIAIERKNWELAALCLLVAAAEKIQALPPEAAEAMLELLAIEEQKPLPRRQGRCRERRR